MCGFWIVLLGQCWDVSMTVFTDAPPGPLREVCRQGGQEVDPDVGKAVCVSNGWEVVISTMSLNNGELVFC